MSLKTLTYRICDGCGKWLLPFASYFKFSEDKRLDICVNCDDAGIFICRWCEEVHNHEVKCPQIKKAA